MDKSIVDTLASAVRRTKRRFRKLKNRRTRNLKAVHVQLSDFAERSLLLQGRIASNSLPLKRRLRNLSEAEFRVYSQWGEDGIIEWLVAHIEVPCARFVEFGVDNFREANCRFLLRNRNWKGLVIDGDERNIAAIKSDGMFWKHDLIAKAAFITAENIDALIAEAQFNGPLGILSIDIDGNDYWVWQSMKSVEPAIVVCEYNAILGDRFPIAVPYDPAFRRFASHFSGLYFGASIAALKYLAEKKGFTFVGTNSNGINAFFVKDDFAPPVLDLLEEARTFPSRHRDSRNAAGEPSYVAGRARFDLIQDSPVIDVSTGNRLLLRDIKEPFSDEWLKGMA